MSSYTHAIFETVKNPETNEDVLTFVEWILYENGEYQTEDRYFYSTSYSQLEIYLTDLNRQGYKVFQFDYLTKNLWNIIKSVELVRQSLKNQ